MFQFPAFASYTLSFQVKIPSRDLWKPFRLPTPGQDARRFDFCPHAVAACGRCAPDRAAQMRRRPFGLAERKTLRTPFPRTFEDKRSRCEAPQARPRAAGRPAPRPEDRPEGPLIREDTTTGAKHRKCNRASPVVRRAIAAPAGRRPAVRGVRSKMLDNHSNRNDFPEIEGGFPHSEIHGSKPIRGSPRLIAAYHVLHRLCMPRHPPNALTTLDRSHCQCSSFAGSG